MKKFLTEILKYILLLCCSVLLGTLLLVLVYLLPAERMRIRVAESVNIFYTEGVYPQLVQSHKNSQLDNETDAIMLLSAIDESNGRNVLEKAVAVPHIYIEGEISGCVTLIANVWENKRASGESDYGRYWHGYLVWLKPLLLLFSYGDIRYLNMFFQFFLLAWVLVLMTEKGMKQYIVPFCVSVLMANPAAVAMSLQFSSVYYIVLISFIVVLKGHEYLRMNNRYYIFFFILGIATVYFDFLTYPTAAFVMPLTLVLLMEGMEWKRTLKQVVARLGFAEGGVFGDVGSKMGNLLHCPA